MRQTVSAICLSFLMLAAAAAHASTKPTVSRQDRAALRTAIRASAKAFLNTRGVRLNRPTVRVSNFKRSADGSLTADGAITTKRETRTIWGGLPGSRQMVFRGTFTAKAPAQGSPAVEGKWNTIYYMMHK